MPVLGRRVPVLEWAVAVGGGRENTLASDSTHHGGIGIAETSEELQGFDSLPLPQRVLQIWSCHWNGSVCAGPGPELTTSRLVPETWQSPLRCPPDTNQTRGVLATKDRMTTLFLNP